MPTLSFDQFTSQLQSLRYPMTETNTAPQASPSVVLPPTQNSESQSLQQYFQDFRTNLSDWGKWASEQCRFLDGLDECVARGVTDFKRDYIFSIGGLMNRSICMAVSSGLTYKLLSSNTASLFARTRNLGVSFVINGWLFVPELFNPFLKHTD